MGESQTPLLPKSMDRLGYTVRDITRNKENCPMLFPFNMFHLAVDPSNFVLTQNKGATDTTVLLRPQANHY